MNKKKRLMSFNVFYAPQSFGGATIVAEEVNKLLVKEHNWEVLVITTCQKDDFMPYHLFRYKQKNVDVISINLPKHLNSELIYKNEEIEKIVRNITKVFNPDISHFHSIQRMGAGMITIMNRLGVPTVVTAHDCWWICERQFMINKSGKYCFQETIDSSVCLHCVDDHMKAQERKEYFEEIISHVDMFLFPSDFHRELHLLNGFKEEKTRTNKNGVKFPSDLYTKRKSSKLKFGFTGGPGPVKGFDLIINAFSEIKSDDYELIVVDGAKNLGGESWLGAFNNNEIASKIKILPPFTQDTMDDFYGDIDVLLFPSLWKESFGLTVREALVRDIWVISTNGGGTTEDLKDGINSTIIPISSDYRLLKKAIEDLLINFDRSFINPFKDDIRNYAQQAEELNDIYNQVTAIKSTII